MWLQYVSIGGTTGEYDVHAYLQSLLSLLALQRDLLAYAANELPPPPGRTVSGETSPAPAVPGRDLDQAKDRPDSCERAGP